MGVLAGLPDEISEDLKQLISESAIDTGSFLIPVRHTSTGPIEQRLELDCGKKRLVALSRDRKFFARTSNDDDTTEIVESNPYIISDFYIKQILYRESDIDSGEILE